MPDAARFEELATALVASFRSVPGARGFVFLGSAADARRRDRWSDHDFFAFVDDGRRARGRLDWLPEPERVLLIAREGELGFAALYDDGSLLEFALGEVSELTDAAVDDFRLEFGDPAVEELMSARRAQSAARISVDAVNELELFLVKLVVGVGRARRGERVVAGQFVRAWAVRHLVSAARAREIVPPTGADPFEPSRRFDGDHPAMARGIDDAVARPIEDAALALLETARSQLAPGWPEFPIRAFHVVRGLITEERS